MKLVKLERYYVARFALGPDGSQWVESLTPHFPTRQRAELELPTFGEIQREGVSSPAGVLPVTVQFNLDIPSERAEYDQYKREAATQAAQFNQ